MSLKNLASIEPENFRQTKVPLSVDLIKEYFENKKLFFIVSYVDSSIKGNLFLTYLSNLDLPFEIDFTGATFDQKFEIMKNYFESRNISDSDVLCLNAADILLTYRGIDTSTIFNNTLFTLDEKKDFIAKNEKSISHWSSFIGSSIVYLLKVFPDLNDVLKIESVFPKIEESGYVGANVVRLFSVPHFMEFFFSAPPIEKIYYFKHQFEDNMFKGTNLFHYFNVPENTFLHLIYGFLNNQIDIEEFVKYIGKIGPKATEMNPSNTP